MGKDFAQADAQTGRRLVWGGTLDQHEKPQLFFRTGAMSSLLRLYFRVFSKRVANV
jgi:hypothetical protein